MTYHATSDKSSEFNQCIYGFDTPNLAKLPQVDSTGPRSAVGNVSGNRCESDCISRSREYWLTVQEYWLTACSSLPRKKCG